MLRKLKTKKNIQEHNIFMEIFTIESKFICIHNLYVKNIKSVDKISKMKIDTT